MNDPVIKWTGSKRYLSSSILKYFPYEITTYYELFCGGCSILYSLLKSNIKCDEYICNDINVMLISFFNELKRDYNKIFNEYENRWKELKKLNNIDDKKNYYNEIKKSFNDNNNIYDFIFLNRTCYNGLIRYNSRGEFNTSFHSSRNGINPDKYLKILIEWHELLNLKNVQFYNRNYKSFLINDINSFCFFDPPYNNSKGIYYGNIDLNDYWNYLSSLQCKYIFTFDGKNSENDLTYNVPFNVYDKHIYLDGKISGFKKLKKSISYVNESLYLKENRNGFSK